MSLLNQVIKLVTQIFFGYRFYYESYIYSLINLGREDKIEEANYAHAALADLAGSKNDFATLLSVYSSYYDRYLHFK